MNYYKKLLLRAGLAVALLTGVSIFIPGYPQAKAQGAKFNNIAPPDEKGPYNVGIRTFDGVTMSGGRKTRIQVFYPTDPIDPNFDPTNCPNTYTIQVTEGSYQRSSPLCAVQNANPAPGPFPLVVHDHGGAPPGNDRARQEEIPLFETLASHGFVIAVGLHSGNAVARVRDLPIVINYMLGLSTTPSDQPNPVSGSIDPNRIGISGFSAGGISALRAASGYANPGPGIPAIPPDPRIKAMVLYEAGELTADVLADASNIAIPYLAMGGNRYRNGPAILGLLDATKLATPRIHVMNPEALHFSYFTDICSLIEETREAALPTQQVEPLTNMVTLPSGLRACNIGQPAKENPPPPPLVGAAALDACTFWNRGELVFPMLGVNVGGGRNFCTRIGVNSSSPFDLDTDGDGFTDSPPFLANDDPPFISDDAGTPIPSEILVPLVKLYTVAFWKKFLEGDGRYMRYLTPGYANTQNLEAVVEIRE